MEGRRTIINALSTTMPDSLTPPPSHRQELNGPCPGLDNAGSSIAEAHILPKIITTYLRPDLILCSTLQQSLSIVELTVPWEAEVGEAYERKRLKYSDIAAKAVQWGWRTQVLPVEVAEGDGSQRTGLLTSRQVAVRGCRAKQQLPLAEKKGALQNEGCKMTRKRGKSGGGGGGGGTNICHSTVAYICRCAPAPRPPPPPQVLH
ncbi:hypothetical protein N1851_013308 [Merluccius polli]|uniref:Uncharacterized protein n=1 Tax=Merluccius polli TaxID=89951 RepID=A0AA47P3S3_MERPO|nr:hypothetical protein N1851_013308 [Merluccius polli]